EEGEIEVEGAGAVEVEPGAEEAQRCRLERGHARRWARVRRVGLDPELDRLGGERRGQYAGREECHAERGATGAGSGQDVLLGGAGTVIIAFRIPNPSSTVRSARGSATQRSPSTRHMYECSPGGSATSPVQTPSPLRSRSGFRSGSPPSRSPAPATERASSPRKTTGR